jgi:hypothetical protein
MKNFVILFDEKEGTSPLVRLLNNFEKVSIIHQRGGWEPFDRHACGPMPLEDLRACLEMVFTDAPTDFARLNEIYLKTAEKPLKPVDTRVSVGFKMRFAPLTPVLPYTQNFLLWNRRVVDAITTHVYRRTMFNLLKRHDVTVFIAVRQDLLRWALSKYHGDGTGNPGHLQFKVAHGRANGAHLEPITVDCARLEEIIAQCKRAHERKQQLMGDLRSRGISAHSLRYEEFLECKEAYFSRFFTLLGVDVTRSEIQNALSKGSHFKKVHSDEISEFVTNHEEVVARVGAPFVSWNH